MNPFLKVGDLVTTKYAPCCQKEDPNLIRRVVMVRKDPYCDGGYAVNVTPDFRSDAKEHPTNLAITWFSENDGQKVGHATVLVDSKENRIKALEAAGRRLLNSVPPIKGCKCNICRAMRTFARVLNPKAK